MTNNTPQVLLQPLRPALIAASAQSLPVLVRVQAPDRPPLTAHRRPYHLAFVIDRSGSMAGAPLDEAIRAVTHVLGQLDVNDKVALITFDDCVEVLCGLTPVGDGLVLGNLLKQITEGGSTNLYGGWLAGVEALKSEVQAASISRVVLLSDGNANAGELTEATDMAPLAAQTLAAGISTSTYGLGRGFNEDLMVALGKQGGGNHYYGATAKDLLDPFAEEFDLLANLYARQLQLAFSVPRGVTAEVLNEYRVETRGGFTTTFLPDLPWASEAWAIVKLAIPLQALNSGQPLLQVGVSAHNMEGEPIAFSDQLLSLPEVSPAHWDALLPDKMVRSRLQELEAATWLEEARAAAEHGDWERVSQMMTEARARFAGNTWLEGVLTELSRLAARRDRQGLRKEAMYSSRKMSTRLATRDELDVGDVLGFTPSYLRRKNAQGKGEPREGS